MRWGRAFVVVVVALVGATLIGVGGLSPARATAPSPEQLAPKLRTFTSDGQALTQNGSSTPMVIGSARTGDIAVGDVTGDQVNDVVIGGSDGVVYIRPGAGVATSFTPFDGYSGPLSVAVGNLDGDAAAEIVAAMGHGQSAVYRIFNADASAVATAVMPYDAGFSGGIRVAVGNVQGDGANEVMTVPGPGGAAQVKVMSAAGTVLTQFIGFDPSFTGGAFIAAGNMDGDGLDEILLGPGASTNWRMPQAYNGDGTSVALVGRTPGPLGNQPDTRVAIGLVNGVQSYAETERHGGDAEVDTFAVSNGAFLRADPADADGALSVAVGGGKVLTLDTAPRMIMLSPSPFLDHTRNDVTLYAAGLDQFAQPTVTLGTAPDAVVLDTQPSGANDLTFTLPIPAFVDSATLAMSLGGAGDPRQLSNANFVAIQTHEPPLDEFVTTGVVKGGGPHVRTFTADGPTGGGFMSGTGTETGGVRVARGDLDGDGVDEIVTGAGPGQPPTVRVYSKDGALEHQFLAYDASFLGGVYVAVGNVGGHGGEIITAPDAGGGPHIKVLKADGTLVSQFMAYDPHFTGGVRVGTADEDGHDVDDIVLAPGPGGGPHVKVVDQSGAVREEFMAYDPRFTGGVFVAGVDLAGEGVDEIVTGPGAGGGPDVELFHDGERLGGFMAYDPSFTGGVSVGRVGDDIAGADLIVVGAGPGGGPHVRLMGYDPDTDSFEEADAFYAYDQNFRGGVFVAGGIA